MSRASCGETSCGCTKRVVSTPCEPPQTQDLLSLDLSRLRVEERVRWEVMASRDRPGETLRDEEPAEPVSGGA